MIDCFHLEDRDETSNERLGLLRGETIREAETSFEPGSGVPADATGVVRCHDFLDLVPRYMVVAPPAGCTRTSSATSN
jgi:hypothetical protein